MNYVKEIMCTCLWYRHVYLDFSYGVIYKATLLKPVLVFKYTNGSIYYVKNKISMEPT